MKKTLVVIIPLFVAALAVGAAFYFKITHDAANVTVAVVKEVPKINAFTGKKPTSGLGEASLSGQQLESGLPMPGTPTPAVVVSSDSDVNNMINQINQPTDDGTSDINSLKTAADQL